VAEVVLPLLKILLGAKAPPLRRLGVIPWNTPPNVVHGAKGELGIDMALLGSQPDQPGSLGKIPLNTLAPSVHKAEAELGFEIALLGKRHKLTECSFVVTMLIGGDSLVQLGHHRAGIHEDQEKGECQPFHSCDAYHTLAPVSRRQLLCDRWTYRAHIWARSRRRRSGLGGRLRRECPALALCHSKCLVG
jgi:hypothetical protein